MLTSELLGFELSKWVLFVFSSVRSVLFKYFT